MRYENEGQVRYLAKEPMMEQLENILHYIKSSLHRKSDLQLIGFDGDGGSGNSGGEGGEGGENPLDGLSDEDVAVLEELDDAGLTPEQIKALHGLPKPDEKDQAIDGLRNTLRKERTQRRQLQKELRALQNQANKGGKPAGKGGKGGGKGSNSSENEDEEDDSSSAETAAEVQRERQRSERLAASFATNALDTIIVRVLGSSSKGIPKFQDVDDVLKMIDREDIDVDQDEDDPAKVEVDEDDVKSALKDLAKRKPHLLLKEKNEEGEGNGAGGSKFGGSRKTGSEKDRKAALKDKYPALNRR